MPLTPDDLAWLESQGIPPDEARRQLALLESGTPAPRLERAARLGDGIAHLGLTERDHWARSVHEGGASLGFFVPASGAASRMFAGLKELAASPARLESDPKVRTLLGTPAVRASLATLGQEFPHPSDAVAALLSPGQLGWPAAPKAFLPFHMDRDRARTALQAQMQECSDLLGPGNAGILHCSLSPEHLAREEELDREAARISREAECRLGFRASAQARSTDTLSLGADGNLARTGEGLPQLRAGGHGSLLSNLALTPGEAVLVKNIDNIQPRWRQGLVVPWRLALAGIALELRRLGDALLRSPVGSEEERRNGAELARLLERLGRPAAADPQSLRTLVDRPVRVAGMVRNDGAPGGGPFWVAGKGLQIVEQSEVSAAPDQQAILGESTHFNPVDMACCLRRPDGSLHDLEAFRDPSRAFLSSKPDPRGGTLTVLEHPGLWNGSMGDWLTVFVEVPPETFLPAKTVFDLAHPWRQPPEGN